MKTNALPKVTPWTRTLWTPSSELSHTRLPLKINPWPTRNSLCFEMSQYISQCEWIPALWLVSSMTLNFFFLFFFFFLMAAPAAYRSSQVRGWIGAAAASLHHSSQQCWIPQPLSRIRNQTHLMDINWIYFCCTRKGTPKQTIIILITCSLPSHNSLNSCF